MQTRIYSGDSAEPDFVLYEGGGHDPYNHIGKQVLAELIVEVRSEENDHVFSDEALQKADD